MKTWKMFSIGLAAFALVCPAVVFGQMPGGRGPGGGGFDPFGLNEIKTQIRATEEEWKVIGPTVRTALTARQAVDSKLDANAPTSQPGGMFGGDGRGGFGGNDSFGGPGETSGGDRGGFGGRGGRGGPRGGDFPPDGGGRGFGGPPGFGGPDGPGGPGDFPPDAGFGRGGRGRGGFGGPDGAGGPGDFPPDADFGRGGRGGRGRGGFGGPGGGPGGGDNPVLVALTSLQTTLNDPKATPDEIETKRAAVRNARSKAQSELDSAVKELRLLLTDEQQSVVTKLAALDLSSATQK